VLNSCFFVDDREAREALKLWCRVFEPEYVDKSEEEEERFKYFKDSLDRKVNPSMLKYGFNHLEFAEIQWPGFWLCLLFYMP
jgi:hypothetical protein